ncbi:FAD/NAD(P)-binding domain-containing protein [Favolaschia claudopus]|uniref:FAD/NAD(P)-binding domain-containing protein n=1 Tax=Favolaschia claudopus TaxID=2862362 RepID=A0AAW0EIV2_9AGAR
MLLPRQLLLCCLYAYAFAFELEQHPFLPAQTAYKPAKRIGIVGLGTGGIAALRALKSLPLDMREDWEVTIFDQRHAVGGLWVPQDDAPDPPSIPQTPAYPGLRMNAVHMHMTVPNVYFPPETPLLAPRAHVLEYWQGLFNAVPLGVHDRVLLQHSVTRASWIGDEGGGYWELKAMDLRTNLTSGFSFDHLIAAPGVNRFPRVPKFEGQDLWLAKGKRLEHCLWFRDPSKYTGQTVIIVGGGPSGLDVARHVVRTARKVYWSRQEGEPELPDIDGAENVPRMTSLKGGSPTLMNGTTIPNVDTIILATGYEVRIPFLSAGGFLDDASHLPSDIGKRLTTNGRYISPLYEHTVSLDAQYPLGALYFISLLTYNPTGLTNTAQATFAAYTIANASLLGTRDDFRAALARREQRVRDAGQEPSRYGHKVILGYGAEQGWGEDGFYQDVLVHDLVARDPKLAGLPGVPDVGFNLTERWRVWVQDNTDRVLPAWHQMVDERGVEWEKEFVRGQRTEADYLDTMRRFMEYWDDRGE